MKSDCESGKLTIKGDVDPSWLRERVEIKTKKTVELISSSSKKGGGDGTADKKSGGDVAADKKGREKAEKKTEDKKADEKKPKEVNIKSLLNIMLQFVHVTSRFSSFNKIIMFNT